MVHGDAMVPFNSGPARYAGMSVGPPTHGILPGMSAYPDALSTRHGTLPLPAFLPDATFGTVRAVDAGDARAAGCARW